MSRYEESLRVLKLALENGIEASLEAFLRLMHFFGDPQDDYPTVHIAGTNGKTSTSRYIAAILQQLGFKTGLYLSPELMFYPERIEVDGKVISDDVFADIIIDTWEQTQVAISQGVLDFITEFEVLTAAGFRLYSQEKVDWGVIEVGLGGLWDATNAVKSSVAVVTGIDLEHTHLLGDAVEEIAVQKAAIIKPGSVAVLGPGTEDTRQVFIDRCAEVGAEYHIIEPPYMDFRYIGPAYQKINIATAWVAAEKAIGDYISPVDVQKALDGMIVPGRFELLREQPRLMIDAAHNPNAARFLRDELLHAFTLDSDGYLLELDTLVLGVLKDKDSFGIIEPLTPLFRNLVVTQSVSNRAVPAEELAERLESTTGRKPLIFPSVEEALADVNAKGETAMFTGSITVAGAAKRAHLGLELPGGISH